MQFISKFNKGIFCVLLCAIDIDSKYVRVVSFDKLLQSLYFLKILDKFNRKPNMSLQRKSIL